MHRPGTRNPATGPYYSLYIQYFDLEVGMFQTPYATLASSRDHAVPAMLMVTASAGRGAPYCYMAHLPAGEGTPFGRIDQLLAGRSDVVPRKFVVAADGRP